MYDDNGDPEIKYSHTVGSGAEAEFDDDTNQIGLSSHVFKNNFRVFLVLIHESLHTRDCHHGLLTKWGYKGYGSIPEDVRIATEVRAYSIQKWFNDGKLDGEDLKKYNYYYSKAHPGNRILHYPTFFNNIQK